jgi:hypothetical protein
MARVHIDLKTGDALAEPADVLVLKHAQGRFGLDQAVDAILEAAGRRLRLPQPWDFQIERSTPDIAAARILFLGVPPLHDFGYKEIRAFAHQAIYILAEQLPHTRHILFTLHGAGYGLDEIAAFEAEIAGLVDAVQTNSTADLEKITIIEQNAARARRLQGTLTSLLPDRTIATTFTPDTLQDNAASETLRTAGFAAEIKPSIFVAMPFREEMDDVYHYGIVSATNAAGFLCERADLSAFTGDVLEWVKSRIRSASLVIADLTDANPNVYLEIGYAWGSGIPTVLVVKGNEGAKNTEHLKFDVRGQRCLVYRKIKELEDSLTQELKSLPRREKR